jgi:hypothetical protein
LIAVAIAAPISAATPAMASALLTGSPRSADPLEHAIGEIRRNLNCLA